jgi:methylated-DNA-[protein]-cysteine S-methyltransferase
LEGDILEGTPFQKKAWHALQTIPYGKTISYAKQAQIIDNPKAVRAIGRANGANPLSIIIPCHRVIAKSGALTGYAGGVDAKKFLLALENAL